MFKKLGQKIVSHYEKQASCNCTPTTDIKSAESSNEVGCCTSEKMQDASKKRCCGPSKNESSCC